MRGKGGGRVRKVFAFVIAFAFITSAAGVGYSAHKEEMGTVKGTVTKIEPSEYEVTVKDDKGKETKVKVKDAAGLKAGESVVIKDGKVMPAVKPKTGGY
jgi:hypothetical protein